MAAERFFTKIANEVLQATEHVSTRMEEGLTAMLKGEFPKQADSSKNKIPTMDLHERDDDDMNVEDLSEEEIQELIQQEMMRNSPLGGIADGVMGDIMSRNVRKHKRFGSMEGSVDLFGI